MPSAPRTKANNHASVLKNLEAAIRDALPLSDMIGSFDELQRERDGLKQQLENANKTIQEKDAQIKEKAGELNSILEGFEKRYQKWSKREIALTDEVQALRQEVSQTRRETQQELATTQQQCQDGTRELQNQVEKQKITVSGLKVRLQETESDLRRLKRDVGLDDYRPAFLREAGELETALHKLCTKFFEVPHPSLLGESRLVVHHPQSFTYTSRVTASSISSAYPRSLVAQAIIAQQLSTEVFSQLYIASPVTRLSMGVAIGQSEDVRPQQKTCLRNLLLSTFSSEDKKSQGEMLQSVSSMVLRDLKTMLSSQVADDFHNELYEFLQSACHLWDLARRSSCWVSTTCNPSVFPEQWRTYVGVNTEPVRSEPGPVALILFPHLYCEGDEKPLYSGSMWPGYSDYPPVTSSDNNRSFVAGQETCIDRVHQEGSIVEWEPSKDLGRERSLTRRSTISKGQTNVPNQRAEVNRSLSRKNHFGSSLTDSEVNGSDTRG
ncbi:hypothetical protein BJX76DRAFT_358714 [Aspergillus varians]